MLEIKQSFCDHLKLISPVKKKRFKSKNMKKHTLTLNRCYDKTTTKDCLKKNHDITLRSILSPTIIVFLEQRSPSKHDERFLEGQQSTHATANDKEMNLLTMRCHHLKVEDNFWRCFLYPHKIMHELIITVLYGFIF